MDVTCSSPLVHNTDWSNASMPSEDWKGLGVLIGAGLKLKAGEKMPVVGADAEQHDDEFYYDSLRRYNTINVQDLSKSFCERVGWTSSRDVELTCADGR
jgi:hypothetical protein